MDKRKKKRTYTVMFVPDNEGKTFYLKVNKYFIHTIFVFCVVFCVGIFFLLLKAGQIGARLQLTYSLLEEKNQLAEENKKLYQMIKKIESIEQMNLYLQRLAHAVGEDAITLSLSTFSHKGSESIYDEDSLDAFIDAVRTDKENIFKDISEDSVSRDQLYLSIPNISPVDGWITKNFHKDPSNPLNNHLGIDFAAKTGTLIRATAPGIVTTVSHDTYFGLLVVIKHKYAFETRYGHCSQILVKEGERVERGQTIALLGNTGRSSAPHLHYEVLKDDKNIDPLKYIFDRLQ